jgi:hypothetical protein
MLQKRHVGIGIFWNDIGFERKRSFVFCISFYLFPKTYIISKKTHINKGIFENDLGFGKINKLSSFFSFPPPKPMSFQINKSTYVSIKMTQVSKN